VSTSIRPRLVNGRFGDPALFVEFAHEREAVLLDCGDLTALSARDLLRIDTVAVSHMHMDHLIGFDALLRINVGREARIDLFGPEGFADRIGHKLQGYTWDLADRYTTDLVFHVAELVAPERLQRFAFRFSRRFAAEELGEGEAPEGVICDTPRWRLTAAILDHHGHLRADGERDGVRRARVEGHRGAIGREMDGGEVRVVTEVVDDHAIQRDLEAAEHRQEEVVGERARRRHTLQRQRDAGGFREPDRHRELAVIPLALEHDHGLLRGRIDQHGDDGRLLLGGHARRVRLGAIPRARATRERPDDERHDRHPLYSVHGGRVYVRGLRRPGAGGPG